ncbi:MAG: hypothetical protein LBD17_05685 [Endomicrobium sp.]|jgi:hypothetical protein|nr:hypothetical protein [Endomicrobium sp.]
MKKTKFRKALLVHGLLSVFLFSILVAPQTLLAASTNNVNKAEKAASQKAAEERAEADKEAIEKAKKEEAQRNKAEKAASQKAAKEKAKADKEAIKKAKKEEAQRNKAEKAASQKAAKERAEADKYEISYFYVYKNAGSSLGHYIPSGYMGDARDILLKQTKDVKETYENRGTSLEIVYTPRGSEGWAGLYWLEPANNWGNVQGGFNLKGATKLTFWAKGLTGTEILSEVKIGGILGKYPDSDIISVKNIGLSKEWQMFEVDLKGRKLSHIIGGFCVIFDKYNNPDGATIFIDDIVYEIKTEK